MLRVVLTGSECTGKTTAAAAIAERLGVPWVPEASRSYAEAKGKPLDRSDVTPIARAHLAAVEAAARAGPPLLVLDTDLISTVVYARHYYGNCPRWIEREARARRADLYLLHAPDLPWIPDPSRDRGHMRDTLHALFSETLEEFAANVVEISGRGPARVERAVSAAAGIGARVSLPGGRRAPSPDSGGGRKIRRRRT